MKFVSRAREIILPAVTSSNYFRNRRENTWEGKIVILYTYNIAKARLFSEYQINLYNILYIRENLRIIARLTWFFTLRLLLEGRGRRHNCVRRRFFHSEIAVNYRKNEIFFGALLFTQ